MYQPLIAHTPAEHRLYRLQAEWWMYPKSRSLITREIRENPEWGLDADHNGPRFKTSLQPNKNGPQTSPRTETTHL